MRKIEGVQRIVGGVYCMFAHCIVGRKGDGRNVQRFTSFALVAEELK